MPRCDQPLPEAADCLFVQSFEAEENLRIGSDEESHHRRYYRRKETLLSEANGAVRIFPYAITPAEYRRSAHPRAIRSGSVHDVADGLGSGLADFLGDVRLA